VRASRRRHVMTAMSPASETRIEVPGGSCMLELF
jgi:hypothetical protein